MHDGVYKSCQVFAHKQLEGTKTQNTNHSALPTEGAGFLKNYVNGHVCVKKKGS